MAAAARSKSIKDGGSGVSPDWGVGRKPHSWRSHETKRGALSSAALLSSRWGRRRHGTAGEGEAPLPSRRRQTN